MADNKNYYMEGEIGDSGVAETRNPTYLTQDYNPFELTPKKINVGEYFSSDSKYDEYLGDVAGAVEEGLTVDDLRAQRQSGLDMAANSIVNNVVIAGTTAIANSFGLVNGILEAASNQDASKLWNNTINRWAANVQESTNENFPIYRGKEYENKSIFEKLGTGVFWAELVKNLGYTEGAVISGLTTSGLVSSLPKMARAIIPSVVSATGEASIEAVNSKNDEVRAKTAIANSEYNKMAQNVTNPFMLSVLDSEYNKTLNNIEEDAIDAGNFVYASNIALLSLSNLIQWGELFSRGFTTSSRLSGALRRLDNGNYTDINFPAAIAGTVTKKLVDATTEGLEEVSQAIISDTPKNYTDYNTFNESVFNPDKRGLVANMWQALGNTYSETMQDPRTAEEFASGFIIGLLGVPSIRRRDNGRIGFGFENNIIGEVLDTRRDAKRRQDLVDVINTRLQDSKTINAYYNGLVTHTAIQDDLNGFVEQGDEFNYRNAKSAMLYSDIRMFDNAGHLDHLRDIINNSIDMSDEGIKTIIEETSKNGEGPFMQNGNPMPTESVRELLKRKQDELNTKIDNYLKDKESIEGAFSHLDNDSIDNIMFLKSQYRDLFSRRGILYQEVASALNTSMEELERLSAAKKSIDVSSLPADERVLINSKIEDLNKINKALSSINKQIDSIISNPNKSSKDKENMINTKKNEEINKASSEILNSLRQTSSVKELRNILDSIEDIDVRDNAVKILSDENNTVYNNYKELNSYAIQIRRAINSLNDNTEVKNNALKLFQAQFDNANNIQEAGNPNSEIINNMELLYNDSLSQEENLNKFQEAQYALLRAINKVNNDEKFRNSFSREYRDLRETGNPTPNAPTRETTGNSETSTVPPVNPNITSIDSGIPVGDINDSQLIEEMEEVNEDKPEYNKPKGRNAHYNYYRPSIPEIHIEASRKRDFRPFDTVANEREANRGVNFTPIYDYLRDNGAFDYVNEGSLKVGDELGFMIDPNFNDNTIFLIDKRNNQIVGSLDESPYSVNRFEGLGTLREKILNEYKQSEDKDSRFIATPTTRVAQIMVGKIPYGEESKSLADIPNVSSETRSPIFGIVRNGIVATNGKVNTSLIINPLNISDKEGRLYLLIPNAKGMYSPAAIRVKHFNREDFNPEDVQVQSTPLYKEIQKVINSMAEASSEEDLNKAVGRLNQYLYLGNNISRTVHIDWFKYNDGSGIRITKSQRDAQGNEIYEEVDGKRVRKEKAYHIFLTRQEGQDADVLMSFGNVETTVEVVDKEEVKKSITNVLLDMDLPIQVNINMINDGGYNNILINSNVLMANITDARVISSWFTTDYIDSQGNIKPADIVPSITTTSKTPVDGVESVAGSSVTIGSMSYTVDPNNTIYDVNGKKVTPSNSSLIIDLAWAYNTVGDSKNNSITWNNKVLLPNGKVLDRNTQKYLSGKEAQEVIDRINGRKGKSVTTEAVLSQIADNQKRVDRTRTNERYYYILEDDGQYHEYERVHERIGSNSIATDKQLKDLNDISTELAKLSDNPSSYNEYLNKLGKHHNIDLSSFGGRTDENNRNLIVSIIKDKLLSGTQDSLKVGSTIDSVIRNFFISNDAPIKPDNMSVEAFNKLVDSLTEIRSSIEERGERFFTNNIVLFQKYNDGTRIAGEVDILSVDQDGNFRIYDVKTSKYSFHDFINRYGNRVNYYKNKSSYQRMSTEEYYSLQLSAYKNLFESQYHTPITSLAILPFVIEQTKGNISGINRESGILVKYNSAVNVPLLPLSTETQNNESQSNRESVLPIFNSVLEIKDPVNHVLPEYNLENSKVGYFILDNKIHRGYLSSIGEINGIKVYMAKVPNMSKGLTSKESYVASNNYFAVLPNGEARMIIKNDPLTLTEQQAKDTIKNVLSKSPDVVAKLSQKETAIYKSETPGTTNENTSQSGATNSVQATKSVNNKKASRMRRLREVDTSKPTWNQEKELAWLDKVLPQLSEEDRIKVVKGLIRVAESGTLAWGQLDNGILTLSDIAAEGTVYHEAFHVVFNLLLSEEERQVLYDEARNIYGNIDNLSLEESMAEGFREYVMTRQNRNLGRRILDFFKELIIKINNWKNLRPSLISYYQQINEGKYVNSTLKIPAINEIKNSLVSYTTEELIILNNAKRNSEGNLLAPNGKPTKLTEKQYAQVRTQSFINWFGDWLNNKNDASKVVDENGEPLVVYHGSNSKFTTFDLSKKRFSVHRGNFVWFTPSKKNSLSFGKNTYTAFIKIKDMGVSEFEDTTLSAIRKKENKLLSNTKYDGFKLNTFDRDGYDTQYVVRDNSQIMLITENLTDRTKTSGFLFDSLNQDIKNKLLEKGWTEEKFNSVSQEERDTAIRCIEF